ncbi:MAG: outer membrane lipoprotein carrier protein LolA [Terriglobales bacterium]
MRKLIIVVVLLLEAIAVAQMAQSAPASCDLEKILKQMDATAATFKSAQANFVWDQYTKVIDEHDTQQGSVFFRRSGDEIQMAADITKHNGVPEMKYVLFTDGKVEVYQPKIDQVTQYRAGKNRAEFESFLVLGFGGSGHDLVRSFNVRCGGMENVMGINTARLELVPKAAKVRSMFSRIILWIDPARGISVQQKFMDEASGDYRLAKYTDIKLNQKISDSAFRLKTTSKTKYISPQG